MRAFVPGKALAALAVDMPTGKGVLLKNLAVLVAEMVGCTQPGQTSSQDNDHA